MADSGSCVDDLPVLCLQLILSKLSGAECGRAACVSAAWRQTLGDELLWRDLCRRDWGLDSPLHPDGIMRTSYRAAYASWDAGFAGYGPLAPRACRLWAAVHSWTRQHLPAVADSLRPGASEQQLDEAEAAMGVQLPLALRVVYRFCEGQQLALDAQLDVEPQAALHPSMLHGMFGSYMFYDHIVSMRLLPLHRLVKWTLAAHEQVFCRDMPLGVQPSKIVFAASFNFNKVMLLDAQTAVVQTCTSEKTTLIDAVPKLPSGGAMGSVLRWMEEFVARLQAGRYRPTLMADAGVPPTQALSLFDGARPAAADAVTRGIRVSATPLFVPEHSQLGSDDGREPPKYFFAYSIHFQLLPVAEQKALGIKRPLKYAQLRGRYWVVRDAAGAAVNEIRGDGVIGQFPLLKAGDEGFTYQSCTTQAESQGFMEGAFYFVPGVLSHPGGAEFAVVCPRFALVVPAFLF